MSRRCKACEAKDAMIRELLDRMENKSSEDSEVFEQLSSETREEDADLGQNAVAAHKVLNLFEQLHSGEQVIFEEQHEN